jgi:hypothetical protein
LRLGLAGLAALYFAALLHHPGARWLRPVAFFTQATQLFPKASAYAIEFRLEGWRCGGHWEPMDPRPYFPIEPDDKESRFQRLGHFYLDYRQTASEVEQNRIVMQALDRYISARHAAGADDGIAGPIGGIQLFKVVRTFPAAGQPIERYRFDPLAPVAPDQRRPGYTTPAAERKRRCSS